MPFRGTILHPFVGDRTGPRFAPTWAFFQENAEFLDDHGWNILHVEVRGELGYTQAIEALWDGPGDLVVVEHDIVPTREHFLGLERCITPYLCAVDYPLYARMCQRVAWVSVNWNDGKGEVPEWVCMDHEAKGLESFRQVDGLIRWGDPGEEWADIVCLGFTRFSEELRREHPYVWQKEKWLWLDTKLFEGLHRDGVRAHIHYPKALHHHRPDGPSPHYLRTPEGVQLPVRLPKDLPESVRFQLGL